MVSDNDFLTPVWPAALQHVDVVKICFVLDFTSPCCVKPADFLELGRALRLAGRQLFGEEDTGAMRRWKSLFQPSLSEDPVARRKFQKPSPAFTVKMPIQQKVSLEEGDRLEVEVLFVGTGIPLIHEFLSSLVHLGHLGLVVGEGRFEVIEVRNCDAGDAETPVWRRHEPVNALTCPVIPLNWLLQDEPIERRTLLTFVTPTRLLADGRPLRKPHFMHIFPFMLRRVTSMLYAHGGVEVLDDPGYLLARAKDINVTDTRLGWHDWRPLHGHRGLVVGGFTGTMSLNGPELEEIYWILAIASLFGIGKGATYGAGKFLLRS